MMGMRIFALAGRRPLIRQLLEREARRMMRNQEAGNAASFKEEDLIEYGYLMAKLDEARQRLGRGE